MSRLGRGALRWARCFASLSSTKDVSSALWPSRGVRVPAVIAGLTERADRLRIALRTGILFLDRVVPQLSSFVSRVVFYF